MTFNKKKIIEAQNKTEKYYIPVLFSKVIVVDAYISN